MSTDSPELLAGIKVVEFAQNIAIPQCGRILAGMGADVVKVEPPNGDAMRAGSEFGPGETRAYSVVNPDKRSIAIDLQSPDAPEVVDALIGWADVVLVAFKQSDLARYGLDWDRARTINPRLVHLTHTPFGPNGPDADRGGYDVLVQAMSGMGFTMNRAEGGVPLPTRPAVNDCGTGIAAALGVVAALRYRDQTGVGQRVDASLLATSLNLALPTTAQYWEDREPGQYRQQEQDLFDRRAAGASYEELREDFETNTMPGQLNFRLYFRTYATSDGLISVAGLTPNLHQKFHDVTGITRPPRGTKLASPEFAAILVEAEARFATETTAHWLAGFRAVGYPCSHYNMAFEALSDEQVRANWFVSDFSHPVIGNYTTAGMPVQFSETPVGFSAPSPAFAADTVSVLGEVGIPDHRVSELLANNTVVAGPR